MREAELAVLRRRIDAETRRRGLPQRRQRLERYMDRLELPDPSESARIVARANATSIGDGMDCRTDGCENTANSRYDRGPYFGLCDETCIPARREELSRVAAARGPGRRRGRRGRPSARPGPSATSSA